MLSISSLSFSSSCILAPLAGYSDLPFRILCRELGAGLCFSEMISSHGLCYRQKKTENMLLSTPAERPVGFQLFGAEISIMAQAAELINTFHPDIVDINMGCPVKKVTKKGAGAALMATPKKAEAIIKEVVKNSSAPVTVKIRKGVDNANSNCCDFAKMIEQCGAAAVTVHGRTWSQGFTGKADWHAISSVKKVVTIPVIGNGDIASYQEAQNMLESNHCDGIMIGRGALGNPWVFHPGGRPQDLHGITSVVMRHLELMKIHYSELERMLSVIKNHIGRYFKCLPGSTHLRKQIYDSNSFSQLYNCIAGMKEIL